MRTKETHIQNSRLLPHTITLLSPQLALWRYSHPVFLPPVYLYRVFQPAGASKGRGIRVAWTLQQILHAQQTMGGRVVQKYVETPMLLPRCSPHPQLPESTARVHPEYPSRRRSHQLRRCTNHGESPGLGSCTSTQRRREEGDGRASRVDEASETEKRKAEFLTSVDAVNITRTLSNDESTSQSRSEAQRAKYHTLRCSGGIRHTGIRSREPPAARKFDIRVWVLVTGWTPLKAFVFDECYLRVCPQGFTLTESKFTDPEVHITNLSVRRPPSRRRQNMRRLSSTPTSVFRPLTEKDESSFGSPPSDVGTWELSGNESDARCRDECDGSEENSEGAVASQAELIQRLGEMDRAEGGGWSAGQGEEEPKTIGERCWRNKVFPAIEGVVRSTLLAAQPFMKPRALSFQLFGFDLHLDRELNPCEYLCQRPHMAEVAGSKTGIQPDACGPLIFASLCPTLCGPGRTFLILHKHKHLSNLQAPPLLVQGCLRSTNRLR